MSPDDYIAIDETLYATRGGISFKTYNKDKPAKYGLNFRSLGSSRRPYNLLYYAIYQKDSRSNWKLYKGHVNLSGTNCWRLWATWLFIERYKHSHGTLLHVHSSGWMAIRQKYYLHRYVKFKSKRTAKKNQRNKR